MLPFLFVKIVMVVVIGCFCCKKHIKYLFITIIFFAFN